MTDTNDKLRALVLAALMVMSVFAMTVALTGSAAANHSSTDDSADAHLDSGETFWQGQTLFVDSQLSEGEELQVRAVNDDGEVGSLEQELTVGSSGNVTMDTSNLDGFYVVTNGTQVLVANDSGVAPAAGASETVRVSNGEFEVTTQTLSASFDDDDLPLREGDTATIEMDSNRGGFTVNITAEGLDEGDLNDIFGQSEDGNDVVPGTGSDEDDDDSVQVNTTGTGDIEANFSDFDEPGDYTFDFEVSDTEVTASASVTVESEDVTAGFSQGVYSDQVGDATTFVISLEDTSEVYLWVGGENVNYLERVHLVDDDEDGTIIVTMNTYKAGRHASTAEQSVVNTRRASVGLGALTKGNIWLQGSDNASANASAEGEGYLIPSDFDDDFGDDGITRFNSTDFDVIEGGSSDITISPNLSSPLEAGSYDLVLSSSDDLPEVDNGDVTIPDEEDVATLELEDRSTDGIRTLVAPPQEVDIDPDDEDDVNELLGSATPSDSVTVGSAEGEVLLVQVNASGTTGYVSDDSGIHTIDGEHGAGDFARGSGIYFNITREGPNQQDIRINLDDSNDVQLINFPSPAETFYVALDTRGIQTESGASPSDGETWTVAFQVGNEDSDDSPSFYVSDGEEERVETTVRFAAADASFNNIVEDELQVAQDANATVSGSSNVAPGSELTIRLRKTGDSPFLKTQTVEVGAGGSWSATFDMSDVPIDTEFTATVRRSSATISDEVDGVVVESTTPTPTTTEPPETTTEPPETTTEPPETTTAPPETTTAPPETTTSGGQPGFGVAIAIVALLGAALLALRRRD